MSDYGKEPANPLNLSVVFNSIAEESLEMTIKDIDKIMRDEAERRK